MAVEIEQSDADVERCRAAAAAWARAVPGAPRLFETLITGVHVRDEMLRRLATEIVQRDLQERRAPSSARRPVTSPRVEFHEVDPFAFDLESLRAATVHSEECGGCGGVGSSTCGGCGGSGQASCVECAGTGRVLPEYRKSSRHVNCTACGRAGTVPCSTCGTRGSLGCRDCNGTGSMIAWLAFTEDVALKVAVDASPSLRIAHHALGDPRVFDPAIDPSLEEQARVDALGPIDAGALDGDDARWVRDASPRIDPRNQRIRRQRLLCLVSVRREVEYEMCGARGRLSLVGRHLNGVATDDTSAPIRKRIRMGAIAAAALAIAFVLFAHRLMGSTPYFAATNRVIGWTTFAAFTGALVLLAGLLRAWRPGGRLGVVRIEERVAGMVATVAIVTAIVAMLVGRPKLADARAALVGGNLDQAEIVTQALASVGTATPELSQLKDDLAFARADQARNGDRLQQLDAIAEHDGPRANDAAAAAKAIRLAAIDEQLAKRVSGTAMKWIERDFGTAHADPEVADRLARAHDLALADCATPACSWSEGRQADAATSTEARKTQLQSARTKLVSALTIPARDTASDPLARLRLLDGVTRLATTTAPLAADDHEIADLATTSMANAAAERATFVLIGANKGVADALLVGAAEVAPDHHRVRIGDLDVHLAIDGAGRCVGAYVVGVRAGASTTTLRGADAILSQAVGHATSIRAPLSTASDKSISRWSEGAIPVAARWVDGTLVELRIGDATP